MVASGARVHLFNDTITFMAVAAVATALVLQFAFLLIDWRLN